MESIWNVPYVEEGKLAACAASAARLLTPRGLSRGKRALAALRRDGREIRSCCALLQQRSRGAERIPAAWEWLLDNAYMARREELSAAGDLAGSGRVRLCAEGPLILALARRVCQPEPGRE